MTVTAAARRLADGAEQTLKGVTALEIRRSLSSPAESLALTCAVGEFPGELGSITVRAENGRTLFSGAVDKQVSALSEAGRTLTIEARSRGALLLDNEAVPCVLQNATLSTVFGLCGAPHGFVLVNPNRSRTLAQYTVPKGRSEWDAICGFTLRAWGRTPYLAGEQVVVDRPRTGSMVVLSNSGGGIPFSWLEHAHLPYNIVSKVLLRDENGYYTSAVHNSSAGYYGASRKRYVVPSTEFVEDWTLDANQRIRRSVRDRVAVTAVLPGILDISPGNEVQVRDDAVRLSNLMVDELRWQLDRTGFTTRLELVDTVYYD